MGKNFLGQRVGLPRTLKRGYGFWLDEAGVKGGGCRDVWGLLLLRVSFLVAGLGDNEGARDHVRARGKVGEGLTGVGAGTGYL